MQSAQADDDKAGQAIEVTVLMPCLNEVRTVGTCVIKAVTALHRLGVIGEVLLADNGSIDGSQEQAATNGARVVIAECRGYGAALQAGIVAAKGTFIIMGDSDESYDFSNIDLFVERLRGGDDLVMGNRFAGGIKPGAMPWHHRYIGNPVLTGILNLFYRTGVRDAHCGLRAFRKASCLQLGLRTNGMEFASEMVVKAALYRQKISEVPIILYPDGRDRQPHLRSFRDGWRHLRFLLILCPFWLYFVPATVLLAAGLGLMAWLTPGQRQLGSITLDLHTMVLGMMGVFLGYQLLWLGIFAKIYGLSSGLWPPDKLCRRVIDHLTIERGLLAGLAMFLSGLAICLWLVAEWSAVDFGPLDIHLTMRQALWGFTTTSLGVQTIFGTFFLGMLELASAKQEQQIKSP
jgi:glycosyltransferase involved in cell wall biosynthesis